jgi:hypothetical protein
MTSSLDPFGKGCIGKWHWRGQLACSPFLGKHTIFTYFKASKGLGSISEHAWEMSHTALSLPLAVLLLLCVVVALTRLSTRGFGLRVTGFSLCLYLFSGVCCAQIVSH